MPMTDYAKLLNPEQCAAATAGDGPLLVLAAAGTGKTRTLVYRVSYLTESGVDPENILLLTFTNRAAREMIERAREQVGDAVGTLWNGTFHHICNRFLRHFAKRLGYANDFTILDQDDSRSLIDQCIRAVVTQKRDFPKREVIASLISSAANRAIPLADVLAESSEEVLFHGNKIHDIAHRYEEKKRELDAMDFDDLLVNGLRLLREHPDVCEFYQRKFRYILVDEYQDTNLIQAQMVDLLAEKNRNLMVVGDDFQCIYSWRGANFRNIMDFPRRWPDAKIIKLERNYRSTPDILNVANACICGNPEQFQKTLRPTRPGRRKPQVYFLRDGEEQAYAVTSLVRRYLDEGYSLGDMAVLYRAHYHSIELQMVLGRTRLPFRITSGVGVFEQAHAKDVIAFLRLCENPRDYLAFLRFLCLFPKIGEKSVEKYWVKLGSRFDAASGEARAALLAAAPSAARDTLQPVLALFADYHAARGADGQDGGRLGAEILRRLCDVFYSGYLQRTYDNAEDREEDVRELARQIEKHPRGVLGFLEEVSLLTNVDAEYAQMQEDETPRLYLSTVHQAKGLEWPVVFVIWASESMFPSSKAVESSSDDSEERRLFYVAVTRAKDELVIASPSMRVMRDGSTFFCKPSRFVKEIPRSLLKEHYGFSRY